HPDAVPGGQFRRSVSLCAQQGADRLPGWLMSRSSMLSKPFPRRSRMRFAGRRPGFTPKSLLLALSTVLVCAGGSWTFDAGSALAPEPADLKSSLAGTYGATAAAVIVEKYPAPALLLWPAHWQL